ncbi:MAG: hypothetical protein P8129_24425, partial [Anaerolineae bacterium]
MTGKRPGLFVLGLYTLSLIAILAPYYNWVYRLMVTFAHTTLFFASLCLVVWALVHHAYKRSYRKIVLATLLGLLLFFIGSQLDGWRHVLTQKCIQGAYCRMDEQADEGPILGGINEIKIDGVERTGAFEGSSHCLFVVCEEEFFYCDN